MTLPDLNPSDGARKDYYVFAAPAPYMHVTVLGDSSRLCLLQEADMQLNRHMPFPDCWYCAMPRMGGPHARHRVRIMTVEDLNEDTKRGES